MDLSAKIIVATRAFSLAFGLASASAAFASTLTNADAKVHELRIETRTGGRVVAVAPKEKIEQLCPEGCTMTLVGVDDAIYRLEGNEMVTIETGGVVYYDGELAKEDDTAEDAKPSEPSAN